MIKYTMEEFEEIGGNKECLKLLKSLACYPMCRQGEAKEYYEKWLEGKIIKLRKRKKEEEE